MEIKQKKAKSLYLMKIFMEETDEDHGLTLKEINSKLEGYGIKPVSRNTLYGDIEELMMWRNAVTLDILKILIVQNCIL